MKAEKKKKVERIEEAFRRIYRQKTGPRGDETAWQDEVMRNIKSPRGESAVSVGNRRSQPLYWTRRFAAAGAAAAALLVIYFYTSSSLPEDNVAGIMVSDPETIVIAEYQDW